MCQGVGLLFWGRDSDWSMGRAPMRSFQAAVGSGRSTVLSQDNRLVVSADRWVRPPRVLLGVEVVFDGSVDFAGDVAFEAAHDLSF